MPDQFRWDQTKSDPQKDLKSSTSSKISSARSTTTHNSCLAEVERCRSFSTHQIICTSSQQIYQGTPPLSRLAVSSVKTDCSWNTLKSRHSTLPGLPTYADWASYVHWDTWTIWVTRTQAFAGMSTRAKYGLSSVIDWLLRHITGSKYVFFSSVLTSDTSRNPRPCFQSLRIVLTNT